MTLDQFTQLQSTQPAFMLWFYNDTCGVCKALWPRVQTLMEENFPAIKLVRVQAEQSSELAGQLRMLSVPGMLLFAEGKEYFRATGTISIGELKTRMERFYGMMF
jgi:thioredoxin 1